VEVPYRTVSRMSPSDPSGTPDSRGWFARMVSEDESKPSTRFVAHLTTDSELEPVMAGHGDHLRVPSGEFMPLRHATVLGQAEIARSGEEIHADDAADSPSRGSSKAMPSGPPTPLTARGSSSIRSACTSRTPQARGTQRPWLSRAGGRAVAGSNPVSPDDDNPCKPALLGKRSVGWGT
jgi:hypothetical protein